MTPCTSVEERMDDAVEHAVDGVRESRRGQTTSGSHSPMGEQPNPLLQVPCTATCDPMMTSTSSPQ